MLRLLGLWFTKTEPKNPKQILTIYFLNLIIKRGVLFLQFKWYTFWPEVSSSLCSITDGGDEHTTNKGTLQVINWIGPIQWKPRLLRDRSFGIIIIRIPRHSDLNLGFRGFNLKYEKWTTLCFAKFMRRIKWFLR